MAGIESEAKPFVEPNFQAQMLVSMIKFRVPKVEDPANVLDGFLTEGRLSLDDERVVRDLYQSTEQYLKLVVLTELKAKWARDNQAATGLWPDAPPEQTPQNLKQAEDRFLIASYDRLGKWQSKVAQLEHNLGYPPAAQEAWTSIHKVAKAFGEFEHVELTKSW